MKENISAVEIYGDSCAGCHALMPTMSELCKQFDIPFAAMPVRECGDLIEKWEIERVPTVLLLDDGQPFARFIGNQPREILEIWIEAKIEEHLNG